jgi:uncharacterized protein YijF (DUF1287 family)
MPNYCFLKVDLRCPNCDEVVTDLLWFQWGYSPGRLPQEEYDYCLGDPIRWRYCKGLARVGVVQFAPPAHSTVPSFC